MNRRKLALLIALSVLLIVLAAVTATTAWEVLGAGYEVAGDGVSLAMLLLFLTYADAELVLFLREKFEGEKKGSISRKVVLLYLLMLLLLIFIGIAYFGAHRGTTETVDSLRDGDVSSIPPEMEEEILPQDLIEEEKTGEEESSVETPIGEGTPYEEPEEQEEAVVEEEEETLSVVSDDAEQVEEEKDKKERPSRQVIWKRSEFHQRLKSYITSHASMRWYLLLCQSSAFLHQNWLISRSLKSQA